MSNHYYLWMVVLLAPNGDKHVIATGLSRFRAEETKRRLVATAPEGWSYGVERRRAA